MKKRKYSEEEKGAQIIYNYATYLLQHIRRVRRALTEFLETEEFKNSPYNTLEIISSLHSRADLHDDSKWSIEEFFPYANHYYGEHSDDPDYPDPEYDKAWKHHVSVNDHHDGYWRQGGRKPSDAPVEAVIEMLCDWTSMSVFKNSDIVEWYNNNRDVLEGYTEEMISVVENYLPVFQRITEKLIKEEKKRK